MKPVKPAGAPGYKCKANADGTWREYWACPDDVGKRGYRPSHIRLYHDHTAHGRTALAARCAALQGQMLAWAAAGGRFPRRGYSGTVASLAREFETDPDSPFHTMKWNTANTVRHQLKIIVGNVGEIRIDTLAGPDFKRWHRQWGAPKPGGAPRPSRARNCIDVLRRIMAWGMTQGWMDCARADAILGKVPFKSLPARDVAMTLDHVEAIRRTAHAMDHGSVALAQVLQFELGLRQRDVIGEWAPLDHGHTAGGIVHGGRRWCNGVQWSDIDDNLVMRKRTTKTGANVAFDLKLYPAIGEEIALVSPERRIGPMIICRSTGEPFKPGHFSIIWRRIADAAGIPKNVRNMDSRAGSISEAFAAGAALSDVMKHAGHKRPEMSMRYNREITDQTGRVAKLRTEKRRPK